MQLLSILYVLQISFASLKLKDTSHADVKGKFPRQTFIPYKSHANAGFQREKKKKKGLFFFFSNEGLSSEHSCKVEIYIFFD